MQHWRQRTGHHPRTLLYSCMIAYPQPGTYAALPSSDRNPLSKNWLSAGATFPTSHICSIGLQEPGLTLAEPQACLAVLSAVNVVSLLFLADHKLLITTSYEQLWLKKASAAISNRYPLPCSIDQSWLSFLTKLISGIISVWYWSPFCSCPPQSACFNSPHSTAMMAERPQQSGRRVRTLLCLRITVGWCLQTSWLAQRLHQNSFLQE